MSKEIKFTISDEMLADAVIERLNALIQDPDVRRDIERLIDTRIEPHSATSEHPSIQVGPAGVGFLGVLNGLIGTVKGGPCAGQGYISAWYLEGNLTAFIRNDTEATT